MIARMNIQLSDLVLALSKAVDLVSPAMGHHQTDVAFIAHELAGELGLSQSEQSRLFMAGALHDIGAASPRERESLLCFHESGALGHQASGYNLIRMFKPLAQAAEIVRFHHVSWDEGRGRESDGHEVPDECHILRCADRIAVLLDKPSDMLALSGDVVQRIREQSGTMFKSEIVDAFESLASKESFWLDVATFSLTRDMHVKMRLESAPLDINEIINLTKMFSHIIDFRSSFTATHSSGVASSAIALARLAGFSEFECLLMKVAGYLHDIGKLAVPPEILEKPAKLTKEEFMVIKSHTYYTYRVLEPIGQFEAANQWAAFHHEHLSGNGYPFHLKAQDLPLGSRIMAVADVFTALTEDRPYRRGMGPKETVSILNEDAVNSQLDHELVSVLRRHYDQIDGMRASAQRAASEEYVQYRDSQRG